MEDVTAVVPVDATSIQKDAAEMVKAAHRAALEHSALIARLADEVRTLEEVLPLKRAALERAEASHRDYTDMVRESFEFYRNVTSA